MVYIQALGHWFGDVRGGKVTGNKRKVVLLIKTLLLHSPFRLHATGTVWAYAKQGTKFTCNALS